MTKPDSSNLGSSKRHPSTADLSKDALKAYREKRDFSITSEPAGLEKTYPSQKGSRVIFRHPEALGNPAAL